MRIRGLHSGVGWPCEIRPVHRRPIDGLGAAAADGEATLIEIVENLFRNDLSVLDRAQFVSTYREVWELKYGEIKRGAVLGDDVSDGRLSPAAIADGVPLPGRA